LRFRIDQFVIAPVQVHEDHAVADGTADGLWRTPGPSQTPECTNVFVVFAYEEDRLAEQGDHQRVTMVRDRRDEVDEMPPGAVGDRHLALKDSVVRQDGHTSADPVMTGATPRPPSTETEAWRNSQPLLWNAAAWKLPHPLSARFVCTTPLASGTPPVRPPKATAATATVKVAVSTERSIFLHIVGFVLT
jgi:hypothetical protein